MSGSLNKRLSFLFIKISRFEFWPYWLFYFPLLFYGFWLALRAKSPTYFTATNPGMKYGGVMGESKIKVLSSIPKAYRPTSVLVHLPMASYETMMKIRSNGLDLPVIMKPDVGERGKDVELIHTLDELKKYLVGKTGDFIAQEFVEYTEEYGVLYYRMPNDTRGQVTSVVQKGFLTVTGNGTDTLGQLTKSEIRAVGRLDYLAEKFASSWEIILPADEKIRLEPIGNHCRGTSFHDANHLLGQQINATFDRIAQPIDGFFYGRFDLKVTSAQNLLSGRDIKILELNGVSSEVAHIYDPDYSLIQAWRDTARHMKIIWKIATKNHELCQPYDHLRPFLKDLRLHLKQRGK